MIAHLSQALVAVALALLLALLIGRVLCRLNLPRVTGYLLTGLLVGPSLATWLPVPALLDRLVIDQMQVISDIALALILITIGMQFRIDHLRRWRKRIVMLSACEIGATFCLVFVAAAALNYFEVREIVMPEDGLGSSSLYIGLFLGVMAIATAPAATLLVMREYESQGPVTDSAVTLIGLNNLCAIVFFNVALHFLLAEGGGFFTLLGSIFFPLFIGGAVGLVMSVWGERLQSATEQQLLMLGGAIGVTGSCNGLGYDALLGCLSCGAILANASPRARDFVRSLRQMDYVLYVLFFILAGAALHLEVLRYIGILGLGYVCMRAAGKLAGCWLGARLGRFGQSHQLWTGPIMLAQAGVAIGLAASLRNTWPGGGALIETIVLGSVVIFELLGPVAVRFGLIQAGEVPILAALAKKAPLGSFEGLHHVVDQFRSSLGLPRGHDVESAADILVKHVMRKNADTIRDDTHFQELLHLIAHSRYDRFPIIDSEGRFKGIIDYSDIRDVVFDPTLADLVVAEDLVKPEHLFVRPNQTLGEVLHLFKEHKDISYVPVLDEEEPDRLLGILSQNDVLSAFRSLK
jgi:Kef-type K+ transport system membrane component KefB